MYCSRNFSFFSSSTFCRISALSRPLKSAALLGRACTTTLAPRAAVLLAVAAWNGALVLSILCVEAVREPQTTRRQGDWRCRRSTNEQRQNCTPPIQRLPLFGNTSAGTRRLNGTRALKGYSPADVLQRSGDVMSCQCAACDHRPLLADVCTPCILLTTTQAGVAASCDTLFCCVLVLIASFRVAPYRLLGVVEEELINHTRMQALHGTAVNAMLPHCHKQFKHGKCEMMA